jgi:hypothetical protein
MRKVYITIAIIVCFVLSFAIWFAPNAYASSIRAVFSDESEKNGYEVITGKRFASMKNTVGTCKFGCTKTTRAGELLRKNMTNYAYGSGLNNRVIRINWHI